MLHVSEKSHARFELPFGNESAQVALVAAGSRNPQTRVRVLAMYLPERPQCAFDIVDRLEVACDQHLWFEPDALPVSKRGAIYDVRNNGNRNAHSATDHTREELRGRRDV